MPKVYPAALADVQDALREYVDEVMSSELAPSTKQTYIRHASTFTRWLSGHFSPGATLRGRQEKLKQMLALQAGRKD